MRGVYADLSGRRYGRLMVLGPTEYRCPSGSVVWKCRCRCGSVLLVRTSNLTTGNTLSCGCLQREIVRATSNGQRAAWRRRLQE